jgi:hypothetical protein
MSGIDYFAHTVSKWSNDFKGVKVVERFQARHCLDVPDEVVDKFLAILERNG